MHGRGSGIGDRARGPRTARRKPRLCTRPRPRVPGESPASPRPPPSGEDTNTRVAALERYVPEVEMRLAPAIASMAGTLGEVRELLRGEDRQRMRAFEQRLEALERKTG